MQKLTQHTAFQTVSIIQFIHIIYQYSAEINIKSVTTEPKKPRAFCTNTAKTSLIVPVLPNDLGIGELSAYRLAKPQSRETQIIAQMKDITEPAYEIYVRGYTNAARNLRNMEGGVSGSTKL